MVIHPSQPPTRLRLSTTTLRKDTHTLRTHTIALNRPIDLTWSPGANLDTNTSPPPVTLARNTIRPIDLLVIILPLATNDILETIDPREHPNHVVALAPNKPRALHSLTLLELKIAPVPLRIRTQMCAIGTIQREI